MHTFAPKRWPAPFLLVGCLMSVSGCGTNFNEALYLAADATGRTFLDILLTDILSPPAESFDQAETPAQEDELDGDDAPPPVGPPLEELTGDPDAGEDTFVSNNCTACHCADAAGGCALGAPSLVGVATETLDDRLRGDAAHPGGKFNLADQDIVDLDTYLSSLGTGDD